MPISCAFWFTDLPKDCSISPLARFCFLVTQSQPRPQVIKQEILETIHYSSTLAWKIPWTEEPGGLHFSLLSCTGEGNGNPLQYSFLENPRDGGAWWAAVYGVAQSQTWLKWLSSSRNNSLVLNFELSVHCDEMFCPARDLSICPSGVPTLTLAT